MEVSDRENLQLREALGAHEAVFRLEVLGLR